MSFKFLRRFHAITNRLRPALKDEPALKNKRQSGGYRYVPPNQYDTPIPEHFVNWGKLLTKHWEITPILVTDLVAYGAVFFMFYWSAMNKTEVKFQRNGLRICDSMDMCHPTIHKLITINQEYKPWPEMADILTKMDETEKRNYRIMMGREES